MVWMRTHPFAKRSKRVCLILTRRPSGQSPHDDNSALLKCRSALQKCGIGSWMPNTLPCSGAIWTLFLGFFDQSLYLDMFSSSVYDFFISFLDNSDFLRKTILNNYLVDKSLKINPYKFRLSTISLLSNHPFYSYACNPTLDTNYQPITKLSN